MTPVGEFTPNECGGRLHHRQVPVSREQISLDGGTVDIDARIAPLIAELWRNGIKTYMSCERHSATGKVWVGFESSEDARTFLDIVFLGDAEHPAWMRCAQWYFGQYERVSAPLGAGGQAAHPKDWEFHASVYDVSLWPDGPVGPQFEIRVNVLFPRRDLAEVTRRVRAYNDTMAAELDLQWEDSTTAAARLGLDLGLD